MDKEKIKSIIESMLYSKGEEIEISLISSVLNMEIENIQIILEEMKEEYENQNRGIRLIKINDSVQFCTKKENYEYIQELFDRRNKPNLSNAALEALAIIAYNPQISRAELDSIRGVNCDYVIRRLFEYNLIEEAGKIDAPGKPMGYKTTNEFLRIFGYENLKELPELPTIIDQQIEVENQIEV